ncbi:MAG: serine hydrolase domain-containing protein [Gemmatimonadales bacterium]
MKRSRSPFSLLAFVLLSCDTAATDRSPTNASADSAFIKQVDAFADSVVKNIPVAGMSILVARGGRTVLQKGYGLADVTQNRRATDTTAYRIGSVTKLITAVAIFRLIEQDKLTLDDSLRTYLPEHASIGAVTIRQVLNHTSGLPDYTEAIPERWLVEHKPLTPEFIAGLLKRERSKPAGELWIYNSTGFFLLGQVIEKVSGVSYPQFIRREISQPLSLRATWLPQEGAGPLDRSLNYRIVDGAFRRDTLWDLPGIFSAGGLYSSVRDLSALVHSIATSKILSRSSMEMMTASTQLPGGVRADYGFGMRLGSLERHRKWGHTGSGRSNRSAVAYYPDDSLTVIVLMNTEHEDIPIQAIDIEGRIARMALNLPSVVTKTLPLDADAAREFVGSYVDGENQYRVVLEDRTLVFGRIGSKAPPGAMLYQGDDEFVPDPAYPAFRFIFQRVDGKPAAIGRFDNGWFVGVRPRIN